MRRTAQRNISWIFTVTVSGLLILLMAIGNSGCGTKKQTNELGFKINEPMYGIVMGKVLSIQPGKSLKTVLIEVQNFRSPTGLKNNPYKNKSISKGTKLQIEWGAGAAPVVGKQYVMPAEFINTTSGIKITLKGSPMELPSSSSSSSSP